MRDLFSPRGRWGKRPSLAEYIDATGDCWIWTGGQNGNGYGSIREDKHRTAHRVVWEILVGPIPDGLVLDHLCRNRLCVNPDHLEAVSNKTNILRGYGACAQHARRRN